MLLLEKKSIEQGGPPSEGLLKISKASLNDKLDHHVLFGIFWDLLSFWSQYFMAVSKDPAFATK